MIDVYDDVLEEHNAILIDDEIKKIRWEYDYPSDRTKPNRHWHVNCGHNELECTNNAYAWAHTLFEIFMKKFEFVNKYNIEGYERIYCNAHTHGIEPHIHHDDGNFTMIYYPRMDWKADWGGGTAIFEELKEGKTFSNIEVDKLVSYKGNRLVIFDAYLPHQAQPVSRECYQLRPIVVFKCNISGSSRERLDFYKQGKENG